MSIPSLLVVSMLLHLYIGTRIIPSLSGSVGATLFMLLLMASATLAPTGLLARRLARPPRADTLAWIGLPFLGLFSSLFVLTLLRRFVAHAVAGQPAGARASVAAGRRTGDGRSGSLDWAGGDPARLCERAAPGPCRHGSHPDR